MGLFSRSRSARRPAVSRRARPEVETLENRLVPSGVDVVSGDPRDWAMYNHDPEGTRYNPAETSLRPNNVGGLHPLWSFPTAGPVASTPAVVNDVVYADDALGNVYAVSRDGQELWHTHVDVAAPWAIKMTASPLVTNRHVIVGDLAGRVWGLDVNTGAVDWSVKPNPHPFATIFSSATMAGHYVAVGVSSLEEVAVLFPGYGAPTFRGSVALLDPDDGHVVWQTYTVSAADSANGASGAAVWSTPSYDRASNTVYVTTGNNYSEPTTALSDSIIALNAANGQVRWANQRTPNDSWNLLFPESPDHPDVDFGDSPQLYRLGGRLVVSAGQKNGVMHVLDAATGAEVSTPTQFVTGGQLGGFHMDAGAANGVIYANANDWPDVFGGGAPVGGSLRAIAGDGSHELWHLDTPSPNLSGVAIANGVVYMQSLMDGHLYAVNAATGAVLANVVSGGQSSGPAISRGQVYLGTGDVFSATFDPLGLFGYHPGPGTITALGLDAGHGNSSARPFAASGAGNFQAGGAFTATGVATHLGAFTHTGTLTFTPTADPNVLVIGGSSVYIAANGARLYASLTGTLNLATGVGIGTDTWTGGTGRFAHAHGTASLTAQMLPDGSFVFTLTGDITY
jgi:polyvinyl alcohol dehydrogenase (cytochrome)